MTPMTGPDAADEARRRWGDQSYAIRRRAWDWKRFEVGTLPHTPGAYGYGDTWEEAFADADERRKDVEVHMRETAN
jgi:hypothetical protein